MAALKVFSPASAIPERSTARYQVTLKDEDGVAVEPSQITDVRLSLRDVRRRAIINNRDNVSAIGSPGGGTLATGLFTMQFDEEDMAVFGTLEYQPRALTLDFLLDGGGRSTREVRFWVRAMVDIVD